MSDEKPIKPEGDQPGSGETEGDAPTAEELVLYKLILDYGTTNNPALIELIQPLYAAAVKEFPEGARMRMLLHTISMAEQRVVSANALMPFLFVETSVGVVSTAALHAAAVWTDGNDPLFGVKELHTQALNLIAQGKEANAVGIVTGLLMLGDRRVTTALGDCWRYFSAEGRRDLSHANGMAIYAPFVDWLIDWLEDSESGEFGIVAAAVARSAEGARKGGVIESSRALPIWSRPLDDAVIRVAEWSFEEFAERIRPRLLQIAADETAPRVMNRVLKAWGIDSNNRIKAGIAKRAEPPRESRSLQPMTANRATNGGCFIQPIRLEENDFHADAGHLILSWAIFNPYGPTWSCLGLLPTEDRGTDVLFHRMLNPFTQHAHAMGVLERREPSQTNAVIRMVRDLFERNDFVDDVHAPLQMVGEAAPNLVRIQSKDPEFAKIVPDLFVGSAQMLQVDLPRDIEWIKANLGRPWDRASAQRDFALGEMRPDGLIILPPKLPTSRETIREWFDLISMDEHVFGELLNFPGAWHGAIDYAAEPLGQTAYTFWQLDDFLSCFGDPVFRYIAEAIEQE